MKTKGSRCKRLEEVKDLIVDILKNNKELTTSQIQLYVEEKISITWKTVKSYLEELAKEGKINKTVIGEKYKVTFWVIR